MLSPSIHDMKTLAQEPRSPAMPWLSWAPSRIDHIRMAWRCGQGWRVPSTCRQGNFGQAFALLNSRVSFSRLQQLLLENICVDYQTLLRYLARDRATLEWCGLIKILALRSGPRLLTKDLREQVEGDFLAAGLPMPHSDHLDTNSF